MLPQHIITLTEAFVQVFDSERSATIEFRKAHNKAAAQTVKHGFSWCGFSVGLASREIIAFLEAKLRFVWDKLQQVVAETELESYPKMSSDLKSFIADKFNPTRKHAERYIGELVAAGGGEVAFKGQTIREVDHMVSKVNAEVELFCVKYAMNEKRKKQSGNVSITYNLSGPNARVNVDSHDYSINVANSENIFADIKRAIAGNIKDEPLKDQLLAKTDELKDCLGKPSGWQKYKEWIVLGANHMELLGPWIPAITHLLGGN